MKRDPLIAKRLALVAGVESAMKRVAILRDRAGKIVPDTGAYYTLNVAWHKLDQAARLLRQEAQ